MKHYRIRKQVWQVLGLIGILTIIGGGVYFMTHEPQKTEPAAEGEETEEYYTYAVFPSPEILGFSKEVVDQFHQELEEDQAINPDVKAILAFSSSLVIGPVVQGTDNERYLYEDWKTGEPQSYGSITLDYLNNLNEQEMNTIIYGHYVYESKNPDRSLAFTPLRELLKEENYDFNRYLALITNDSERYFEIVSVYDCPMETVDGVDVTPEDLQFNLVSYDEEYFDRYLKAVKEHEYYDTGVIVTYDDKLLTLQTCIENKPESREIIICKEMYRSYPMEE